MYYILTEVLNVELFAIGSKVYLEECLNNFRKKALKFEVSDNFLQSRSIISLRKFLNLNNILKKMNI